ncbi:DUF1566 domain-containing protein [Desulfuromonas sp. KJ2020]|uniref:Lcl domain-containing protein n=1 Tax=Desulfuromonas sp. KJ2020 TaxID=2919173 RepID=UPI0020A8316F|nr:DUF1566 domain-containing protein [Desulfuromonas sp. KJ2020]MCP3177268.1 DUF1566 domain-containing protein [Desulfuromonas sp. KJ2020]
MSKKLKEVDPLRRLYRAIISASILLATGCGGDSSGNVEQPIPGGEVSYFAYEVDPLTSLRWEMNFPRPKLSWPAAYSYCSNLDSGDGAVWRMPTPKELISFFDYKAEGFPFTLIPSGAPYYESEVWAYSSPINDNYYAFNSSLGYLYTYMSNSSFLTICVSGDNQQRENLLNLSENTVLDQSTGILWQKRTPGAMTWTDAMAYCDQLNLSGFTEWHLPSVGELYTIITPGASPAIDTDFFEDTFLGPTYYRIFWTSSETYPSSLPAPTPDSWYIRHEDGTISNGPKDASRYVRCAISPSE